MPLWEDIYNKELIGLVFAIWQFYGAAVIHQLNLIFSIAMYITYCWFKFLAYLPYLENIKVGLESEETAITRQGLGNHIPADTTQHHIQILTFLIKTDLLTRNGLSCL
jgi:hypothetical protein